MRAYFYDDIPGDQRLAHDTGDAVSVDRLAELGVLSNSIPIDEEGQWQKEIDEFAKARGYKNVSSLCCLQIWFLTPARPDHCHTRGPRRGVRDKNSLLLRRVGI